jgi:hypothetical protein
MTFLGEEVEGALTTHKIHGGAASRCGYTPMAATLHVQSMSRGPARWDANGPERFCVFCESRGHWAQDCKRVGDIGERIDKLKRAKPLLPLPEQRPHIFKLQKEREGAMRKMQEAAPPIPL